eukprot:COSAG02_NODE_5309_length_4450_cov_1.799127_3_plen_53_part_00
MDDRQVTSFTYQLLEAPLTFHLLQERIEYCTLGEIWVNSFWMLREETGHNLD